jgi:hypothetical protein
VRLCVAVPLLLVVAIGLGPVILGILCAVGFGLMVFVVVDLAIGIVIGLALLVRSVRMRRSLTCSPIHDDDRLL